MTSSLPIMRHQEEQKREWAVVAEAIPAINGFSINTLPSICLEYEFKRCSILIYCIMNIIYTTHHWHSRMSSDISAPLSFLFAVCLKVRLKPVFGWLMSMYIHTDLLVNHTEPLASGPEGSRAA